MVRKSFHETNLPIGGPGVAQVGSGPEMPGPVLADWGVLQARVANFGPRTERQELDCMREKKTTKREYTQC